MLQAVFYTMYFSTRVFVDSLYILALHMCDVYIVDFCLLSSSFQERSCVFYMVFFKWRGRLRGAVLLCNILNITGFKSIHLSDFLQLHCHINRWKKLL